MSVGGKSKASVEEQVRDKPDVKVGAEEAETSRNLIIGGEAMPSQGQLVSQKSREVASNII